MEATSHGTAYLVDGCDGAVVVVLVGGGLDRWVTGAVEAGGVVTVVPVDVWSPKANIATMAIIPAIRTAPMMYPMALPAPAARARASGLLL